ncbi:hypothetical protein [Polaribacter ponticola]|uniref:ArsR family transcriptional regulator n=1 Tax=Polaribacter ponticola TaxID=2978475 RepID=A0ABT5S8H3_9FLAO|nr:hypothetical protein [Polaribacter sp. MSW5]MDD7914412.1 hypothetical protein [Polaribacter sp. MSW5]
MKNQQKNVAFAMYVYPKREKNEDISFKIISLLKLKKSCNSQEINQHLEANEKDILIHLRKLLSEDKIEINNQNKYQLK